MFYTILVPSTIRANFALFVDSFLSRSEDHNLVHFFESEETCALRLSVKDKIIRHTLIGFVLASDPHAGSMFPWCVCDGIGSTDTSPLDWWQFDVWSIDFNPNRLVSDLMELDCSLRALGCYGAVHLWPINDCFWCADKL